MIQYTDEVITVFESEIYKTTSTVIQTEDCIIVVDPTLLSFEVEEIRQFVFNIKENRPVYLIFTHSDWDHIVGAGAFPEAKVIASKAFTLKNKAQIVEQVKEFDDQYYIERSTPVVYPNVDISITKDGEQLQIGQTTLTFYLAKGHTDDGIFTIINSHIFIAGDYLSDIEFPFIYSSSSDYVKTLEKIDDILNKHHINMMIPGHGHVAYSKKEILKRKNDSLHYINSLKKAINTNTDHEYLMNPYPFKRSLKKCHNENVQFLLNELNVKDETNEK